MGIVMTKKNSDRTDVRIYKIREKFRKLIKAVK